jgi:hypothetical protein
MPRPWITAAQLPTAAWTTLCVARTDVNNLLARFDRYTFVGSQSSKISRPAPVTDFRPEFARGLSYASEACGNRKNVRQKYLPKIAAVAEWGIKARYNRTNVKAGDHRQANPLVYSEWGMWLTTELASPQQIDPLAEPAIQPIQ